MVLQNRVVYKTDEIILSSCVLYNICRILSRNTESNLTAIPQRKMKPEFGTEP